MTCIARRQRRNASPARCLHLLPLLLLLLLGAAATVAATATASAAAALALENQRLEALNDKLRIMLSGMQQQQQHKTRGALNHPSSAMLRAHAAGAGALR